MRKCNKQPVEKPLYQKKSVLEDLTASEMHGLITHEMPNTLTKGHPVQCASCGTSPDRTKELHGKSWPVYWFICDYCNGSDE